MATTTSILIENIDDAGVRVRTFALDSHEVLSVAHLAGGDSEVFYAYPGQGIEVLSEEDDSLLNALADEEEG